MKSFANESLKMNSCLNSKIKKRLVFFMSSFKVYFMIIIRILLGRKTQIEVKLLEVLKLSKYTPTQGR